MRKLLKWERIGIEKGSKAQAGVRVLVVLLLLVTQSCASQMQLLQEISAPKIGCPVEGVVITNVQRAGTRPRTWNAACQDLSWSCTNELGRVTCVAAEPPPK